MKQDLDLIVNKHSMPLDPRKEDGETLLGEQSKNDQPSQHEVHNYST
jgi:hypothetical protein